MENATKSYELTITRKNNNSFEKVQINSSLKAAEYIRKFYHEDIEIYESFFILLLDNTLNTIGYAKISQGGLTSTVVDVRIICKYAIDSLAVNVMIAHNHPSGTLRPSESDLQITKKIKNALNLLDVNLTDHIILTANNYYSFRDNGDI